MASPAETIALLFGGLRPKAGADPASAVEIRALLREIASAPPKDLVRALSGLEGEVIERATAFNQLQLLAAAFVEHGEPEGRLRFAKCAALQGAPKPAGGDQPGAGAAAATVLAADPATIESLRIEKGSFPEVLVRGIYWNGVYTTRGKYLDPPPMHDCGPLVAWNEAVARSANAPLRAASLGAGAAALGRFLPQSRRELPRLAGDPFGLKAVQAETERVRAGRRAPLEGLLAILETDPASGEGPAVQAIFAGALALDDVLLLERIGRAIAAATPAAPAGARERSALLAAQCDPARAERLGTLAAALDRAFAGLKAEPKKQASAYARIALASLGRRAGGFAFTLAAEKDGVTIDPVAAALEKRFLEKHELAAGGPLEEGERVERSAAADLFGPRATRSDGSAVIVGEKGLTEAIGAAAAARYRAAFVRAFDAASAVAVVGGA